MKSDVDGVLAAVTCTLITAINQNVELLNMITQGVVAPKYLESKLTEGLAGQSSTQVVQLLCAI